MKDFIKTTKGKVTCSIIALLIIVGGFYGFNEYTKYLESMRSKVDFLDAEQIGLSEDLMNLVIAYDADTVAVVRIVDENEKVVDVPSVGKYTIIYEAVKNGKATEFKKEITFVDDIAPVIENVVSEVEMDYGTEYNPEGNVKAIDNLDGEVELVINKLESSTPQKIMIEYFAKDTAGNETRANSIINVKAPGCAVNATFNWETGDCGCDAGYTGDGWSACAVEKKAASSASGSKTTTSSGGSSSKGSGSTSTGTSSNTGSTSSNTNGGWYADVPSQEAIDRVHEEGNAKYGEGNSWGAGLDSDGNITNWW